MRCAGLVLMCCAFALLLCGRATGETRPHAPAPVAVLTTVWRPPVPVITIEPSLPVGTVIAAIVIPEGRDWFTAQGRVTGGIWSRHGLSLRGGVARTNLAGVLVRVVQEKSMPANGQAGFFPRTWRQGGMRIELVKNGVIHEGLLTRLQDPLEYRLYAGRDRRRLLARERLMFDGVLSVRVAAGQKANGGGTRDT